MGQGIFGRKGTICTFENRSYHYCSSASAPTLAHNQGCTPPTHIETNAELVQWDRLKRVDIDTLLT